jgi:2-dehydro-3-deoxyphosphooctonate aldolase (KDO 8-P synthase)
MLEEVRAARIGPVQVGGGAPLGLIAGPCVIESADHALFMAERIAAVCGGVGVGFVFKASYDKANRTSVGSFRGPGLEEGLRILERVRAEIDVPVLSDVHSAQEAAAAGEVLDCVQVPAFLCRQTDLLIAAGRTGKAVAVKKGQFLAPWDVEQVIAKIASTGNEQILVTERGVSFGYNNLVTDFRALPFIRGLGVPVVYDATHSVQLPGGQGSHSGGQREFVAPLARAAAAAGCDAIFLEVHDRPGEARCDGPNMVVLDELKALMAVLRGIDALVRSQA